MRPAFRLLALVATLAACTTSGGTYRHVDGGGGDAAVREDAGDHCKDGVTDGDETDVDCGGATCARCGANLACLHGSDCQSGNCNNNLCAPATSTCSDGMQDGAETDVDCGGGTCPTCAIGRHCTFDSDCQSGKCSAGVCTTSATSTLSFAPGGTIVVGSGPIKVIAADLNLDVRPDLAVTNLLSNTVTVHLNLGGAFSANSYPTDAGPLGLVAADFNGDAWPDLVVANRDAGSIGLLENNGTGTFLSMLPVGSIAGPEDLGVLDFNNDGLYDIAASFEGNGSTSQGGLAIITSGGGGGFGAVQTWPGGTLPTGLVTAMFTGNGLVGAALVNADSDSVQVFLPTGSGGWSSDIGYPVGGTLGEVAAGDVNHDGAIDLAVTNSSAMGVTVLLNNGAGAFASSTTASSFCDETDVALADLNHDGNLDIATTCYNASELVVFLGSGDGSFRSGQQIAGPSKPAGLAAADLNGDGKIDLAVCEHDGGQLYLLLNTTP